MRSQSNPSPKSLQSLSSKPKSAMPSKSKKKVAAGGAKEPKSTSQKRSSAASTNPVAASPASVSHLQHQTPIQQQQSSSLSPPLAPTPRTLAFSQSQQRTVQVESVPRANSTTGLQTYANEEEEVEEEAQDEEAFAGGEHEPEVDMDQYSDDEASSDEDDAANEGLYMTLSALLTAPGRDGNLQRLSPHIEEGTTW